MQPGARKLVSEDLITDIYDEPVDNLYEIIESLPNKDKLDILFITGIEKSLVDYIKLGIGGEGDYYKLDTVPRTLGHLNLQRERFRDDFKICFVFLLPKFALKYFIRRSPDFFDWRSGVLEFATNPELVEQESSRIVQEGDYEEYLKLTSQERNQKIWEINELLEEEYQTLEIKPDLHQAWNSRGIALLNLSRLEEALASLDNALEIKPDKHEAWYNKACCYALQGNVDLAIANLQQAINLNPDKYREWAKTNSALDSIREDGRFQALIDG